MTQENILDTFRETFRLNELTISQSEHWVLSVRPEQLTLGSMVLSSSKGKTELSQLTAEEGAALVQMLSKAETLAKDKFGAVRINAICLMMKDPVVHFHILPRYDKDIEFGGVVWHDKDYPKPPSIRPVQTEKNIVERLLSKLRD
ncbi:hypothetical protein [Halomonas sp. BM-2019]|uniref:HIT family protein n=1 Tax=Halomonas sp. BM-2019 TaxID=2811227 RepID=UPI001B3C4837|nr:MAG: hypothetical protein J5F18_12605 [Halomonas sp. BM-2019]